jgi:polar amino acid transport system substrate-binding protein
MSAHKNRMATSVATLTVVTALSLPAHGATSPGFFMEAQARSGAHQYMAYCATCHGTDLRGPQLALKGPAFVSLGKDTGMTLGQFFDFVVRDTPAGSMTSLSHEQYVEIMAYIMQQNGYVAGSRPLRFERALHLKELIAAQPASNR